MQNYTQKKIIGKQHTWNEKKWYEEEDGVLVYQHARDIWADLIPPNPPPISTQIIQKVYGLKLTADKTVPNRLAFFANDLTGNRIRGFIPPSYGVDYTVDLFINGVKIPSSHASNWIFDYSNGVLSFETSPPDGIVTINAYSYIGKSIQQYIDSTSTSISMGFMGVDEPLTEYTIQHNLNTLNIEPTIYVYEMIDGMRYWKKDFVPLILLDENRIKIQLSEELPIKFVIKAYY